MRKKRTPTLLAIAGLVASLVTFMGSGVASAAEYIPPLQWPAVQVGIYSIYSQSKVSPQGQITLGCHAYETAQDLVTYSSTGSEVRRLPHTQQIDGVANCIYNIAVDKNGDLYGSPRQSANLLAYRNNTLKWKYPLGCTYYMANPVVGADGNIYAVNGSGRLVGLTPEVEAGTTQPKKILDAPVSNARCDTTLLAHKDGLIAVDNARATFYSYSGVNLGSTPSDAVVREENSPINATGRVFYDKYVESGGLRGATVSAYDYGRRETTWTATVSANGAYVYSAAPRATPDGGAIVYLREREQDQFGAITGRTALNLVKLNAFGIVQWRKNLPLRDPSQNPFAEPEIKVDANGNIVVVRNGKLKTNDPNNAEVNAIHIAVFNSSGTAIYNNLMRGNTDKTAGTITGYQLKSSTLQPAPGVLYFSAQPCLSDGCFNTVKLYPIKVAGLGLDYPRGAIYTRTQRPGAAYIALGDSFSSGEGVEPFEAGTAIPLLNKCHRSDYAYARLISGTSPKIPSLGSNGFRACSGAVTEHITDAPQWNEGTQLDLPVWPDTTTQLVTLTIGGNDIGFSDFGKACFYGSCAIGSEAYTKAFNKLNTSLPGNLEKTYKRILEHTPNAQVYVLGYPHVIADKTASDPVDSRCMYMYSFLEPDKWGDVKAARNIVTLLNDTIRRKVEAIGATNPRLTYIPFDGEDSPFKSHEICGAGTTWFHNVNQGATDVSYVFHPNKLGQEAYGATARAIINAG